MFWKGSKLRNAAENGDLSRVEDLLLLKNHHRGANVNAKNRNNGWTALHFACANNHLKIVKLLLEKDANVHAKSKYGDTPLHLACENGHFEVMQWLIEKGGADVHAKMKYGYTPLHQACENGNLELVQWLVEKGGANAHAKTKHMEWTPLRKACYKGHFETVKWLVEVQGAGVQDEGELGSMPLYGACCSGNLELVKWLVVEKGADVHAEDDQGWTPLHEACESGNLELVKWLVAEKGANVAAVAGDDTPASLAQERGHTDMFQFLKPILEFQRDYINAYRTCDTAQIDHLENDMDPARQKVILRLQKLNEVY